MRPKFTEPATPLQWGRGFAATEGTFGRAMPHCRHRASMGPWLRSHGRRPASRPHGRSWSRFNGAVASQPRKVTDEEREAIEYVLLQWGRGFAATEGLTTSTLLAGCVPLQWGRGFAATEGNGEPAAKQASAASMGPWLRSHGRTASNSRPTASRALQWGRGFAATEGKKATTRKPRSSRFNGAVASQPRKGGLPKSFRTMGPECRLRAPRRPYDFFQPFASTRAP